MTDNGIVKIHGKEYMTVAKRVELFNGDQANKGKRSITTEVIQHAPIVVVRALVVTPQGLFSGISSVDTTTATMLIEKQNPYEVAETSAVGRALGLAGYGVIESIASADEIHKAGYQAKQPVTPAVQAKGNPEPVPWEQSEAKAVIDAKTGSVTADERGIEDSINETLSSEGDAPPCPDCGTATAFKEGVSGTGKAWKGYFCTGGEKGHKVQWIT